MSNILIWINFFSSDNKKKYREQKPKNVQTFVLNMKHFNIMCEHGVWHNCVTIAIVLFRIFTFYIVASIFSALDNTSCHIVFVPIFARMKRSASANAHAFSHEHITLFSPHKSHPNIIKAESYFLLWLVGSFRFVVTMGSVVHCVYYCFQCDILQKCLEWRTSSRSLSLALPMQRLIQSYLSPQESFREEEAIIFYVRFMFAIYSARSHTHIQKEEKDSTQYIECEYSVFVECVVWITLKHANIIEWKWNWTAEEVRDESNIAA